MSDPTYVGAFERVPSSIEEMSPPEFSGHINMSPWEGPRAVGRLVLAYVRNLPHIPAITREILAERNESPEFRAAMDAPHEVECSDTDGIMRKAWLIPALNGSGENTETIVMLPGLSVQHNTGLGRENLLEFHLQLPDHNILAIGSEGLESSIPSEEWLKTTTFESQAAGRLEMIDKLRWKLPKLDVALDRYHIVGESMGTILGFLMAAQAEEYGQTVEEMIAIAPAGIEETNIAQLFRKFVVPEAVDLIDRICSTPVEKVGYFIRTLLGTANINPAAIPTLIKHTQLIASKPAPLDGIGERLPDELAVKILAGDQDFVANPAAFQAKLARAHSNSSLHVYPGEHHVSLTRAHKMAKRTAHVITEPSQVVPLYRRHLPRPRRQSKASGIFRATSPK